MNEMNESESEPKLYEVSYFLKASDLSEAAENASRIAGIIEKEHGIITFTAEPALKPLSYPLNKTTEAYWGWLRFLLKPEALINIKEGFKNESPILRFMLVNAKKEERLREPLHKRKQPILASPEKQADLEAIDKKLEEILG